MKFKILFYLIPFYLNLATAQIVIPSFADLDSITQVKHRAYADTVGYPEAVDGKYVVLDIVPFDSVFRYSVQPYLYEIMTGERFDLLRDSGSFAFWGEVKITYDGILMSYPQSHWTRELFVPREKIAHLLKKPKKKE